MLPKDNDVAEGIQTQFRIFKVQHLEMRKGIEDKKFTVNII